MRSVVYFAPLKKLHHDLNEPHTHKRMNLAEEALLKGVVQHEYYEIFKWYKIYN